MKNFRTWLPQPEANEFYLAILDEALSRCKEALDFKETILSKTAIRFQDIVDHIVFPNTEQKVRLAEKGWQEMPSGVWRHFDGLFPDFIAGGKALEVHFRTESVENFLDRNGIEAAIEGKKFNPLRRAKVFEGDGVSFWAVERNGYEKYDVPEVSDSQIRASRIHLQAFRARRREFSDPGKGFDHTEALVDKAVQDLGQHWTCDTFFRAEREYWMARCAPGRIQKERQDAVGLGWANIDHHTYDSSRVWFHRTINILEKMGFECRELFYAGHMAGWGSQVLEQPVLRSTIFADIDLAPDELAIDFAHMELKPLKKLRRAGILCAMHGESMLEGGLNHIAGFYDQKIFREIATRNGIQMMPPFSDYPHLYQELTIGEWRAADPRKITALENGGHLSAEEAEDFRLRGSIVHHLENIERNDGYKGFNQPGIDDVLKVIDPRQNLSRASV